MIDILLVNNRFPPNVVGGADLTVFHLASELHRRGKKVCVLSLSNDRASWTCRDFPFPVIFLPNFNVYNQFARVERNGFLKILFFFVDNFNLISFFYILRIFFKERPRQIWTHNLKGIGILTWVAAKLTSARLVHVSHDYWLICPSSTMFRNGKVCTRACDSCRRGSFFKRILSNFFPDYFISVSSYVKNIHINEGYFGAAKALVAHNGRPFSA